MSKLLKAQMWYIDFILGLTIFLLMVFFSLNYVVQSITNRDSSLAVAQVDQLGRQLMGRGVPDDWTADNLVVIGLTSDDNLLDLEKVGRLANLTSSDYDRSRRLMGLTYDYLVYFEDRNGTVLNFSAEYIGKPGYNTSLIELDKPDEQAAVTRYVALRQEYDEVIAMKVVVWD